MRACRVTNSGTKPQVTHLQTGWALNIFCSRWSKGGRHVYNGNLSEGKNIRLLTWQTRVEKAATKRPFKIINLRKATELYPANPLRGHGMRSTTQNRCRTFFSEFRNFRLYIFKSCNTVRICQIFSWDNYTYYTKITILTVYHKWYFSFTHNKEDFKNL